jgi:hypothetical protein
MMREPRTGRCPDADILMSPGTAPDLQANAAHSKEQHSLVNFQSRTAGKAQSGINPALDFRVSRANLALQRPVKMV